MMTFVRSVVPKGALKTVLKSEKKLIFKIPNRKCGIFAALSNTQQELNRTEESMVRLMCSRIQHRGPDGTGVSSGNWKQGGRWSLGHTRLAIVAPDQETADQPFHFPKKVAVVANGEIYNHKDIYEKLRKEYDWKKQPISRSDCEAIVHGYKLMGPDKVIRSLDGMFAFVVIDEEKNTFMAGRDPTGIKPLYYAVDAQGNIVAFASELKALVDLYGISQIHEFPNGHYYTPETGFVRWYDPEWRYFAAVKESKEAPWECGTEPTAEEIRNSLDMAVMKRLMSDVDFGLFLSGGVDSCIIAQLMLKHCRSMGFPHPPSYTIGMNDGPDIMAARAMAKELGTRHHERIFDVDEAFSVIEKVVYHIETYNAELIRSAIPNWFLAERAAADVKMVITGEGADEIWAGYAYFEDATSPEALHRELCRIYDHLGVANLIRADRMTMAHSLEARVPFLDTEHCRLAMSLNPAHKMIEKGGDATKREKAYLRKMFDRPHYGIEIPKPVLWRMKAMQCEGIGEDWVSILQRKISEKVSDAAMDEAEKRFPFETPQTKEEYFYRELFDNYFPNCEKVPTLWEGGCRAAGAEFKSTAYTREGLQDVSRLTHALQGKSEKKQSQLL